MSVRPPQDPYAADEFIDYDVYDLDQLNRGSGGMRPTTSRNTARRGDAWNDPRFLVPLLLFLSAVFVIFMAWRSQTGSSDTSSEAQTEPGVEMSKLAQQVSQAQLRAGFDGLTITEEDGVVIIEGQARDALTAASIGAVARSVEGTQRVDNRVVVPGGAVDVQVAGATSVAPVGLGLSDQLAALGKITFETGSAALTNEGAVVIDGAAALLANDPGAQVEVHGHTDSDGDDARNQVLSQDRAQAVVTALVARGIDPARLTAVGFGESKPIEPNITEEGRTANRRIEFLVLR